MSETRSKRRVEFIESYWKGGEYGSDYKWNDNHGELVRCKDCKHSHRTCDGMIKFCDLIKDENDMMIKLYKSGDWFCADGKRRTDDD